MRPRIHYTQQSSSWRRVARIVRANRMLRDRTLSIALRVCLSKFEAPQTIFIAIFELSAQQVFSKFEFLSEFQGF